MASPFELAKILGFSLNKSGMDDFELLPQTAVDGENGLLNLLHMYQGICSSKIFCIYIVLGHIDSICVEVQTNFSLHTMWVKIGYNARSLQRLVANVHLILVTNCLLAALLKEINRYLSLQWSQEQWASQQTKES